MLHFENALEAFGISEHLGGVREHLGGVLDAPLTPQNTSDASV